MKCKIRTLSSFGSKTKNNDQYIQDECNKIKEELDKIRNKQGGYFYGKFIRNFYRKSPLRLIVNMSVISSLYHFIYIKHKDSNKSALKMLKYFLFNNCELDQNTINDAKNVIENNIENIGNLVDNQNEKENNNKINNLVKSSDIESLDTANEVQPTETDEDKIKKYAKQIYDRENQKFESCNNDNDHDKLSEHEHEIIIRYLHNYTKKQPKSSNAPQNGGDEADILILFFPTDPCSIGILFIIFGFLFIKSIAVGIILILLGCLLLAMCVSDPSYSLNK